MQGVFGEIQTSEEARASLEPGPNWRVRASS